MTVTWQLAEQAAPRGPASRVTDPRGGIEGVARSLTIGTVARTGTRVVDGPAGTGPVLKMMTPTFVSQEAGLGCRSGLVCNSLKIKSQISGKRAQILGGTIGGGAVQF